MINNENLEKLYNEIISNGEIATKLLNEFKFNSIDLSTLQKNNLIVRTRWGHYTIADIDKLYAHGLKLLDDKNFNGAFKCFERCYELKPNHRGACLQLLLRSIRGKDYTAAIEYYETLANSEDEYYQKNANFYLYLISFLAKLPDKYKDYAKHIDIKQISLTKGDKVASPEGENNIRDIALHKKFATALKEVKNKINGNNVHKYIVLSLLNDICELEVNVKQIILSSCIDKNYKKIVDCLEDKKDRQKLTTNEDYILKLAYALIELDKTKKIPSVDTTVTGNLYVAIDNNNYRVALTLSNDYNRRNNIANADNPINILLNDICRLMANIRNNKVDGSANIIHVSSKINNNEEKEISSDDNTSVDTIEEPITIANVIGNLIKGNLNKSFDILTNFLNNIDAIKYQFLIIDLIKISLLENDLIFTKPIDVLKEMENKTFSFNLGMYVRAFYTALANRKLEIACIYLNIIEKVNEIDNKCILTSGMAQILSSTEKALNYQYNNKVIEQIDTVMAKSDKVKKYTV